jgi:hypothetical protein
MASTQMRHKQVRPTIFLAGCILIILLGAVATFFWQTRSELPARAASGYVVGPPTLPAATVDSILASMGSPMVGTGAVIEQASRQTNIDDAFALAVWWTETNDGAAGVGLADRNPGSVRESYGYPAAFDGYTIYSSYSAGIIDWFNVVRTRYVDQGLTSAYTICYPYVGTSSSYQWAIKVVNLMSRYQEEAPPPPPPTPTPIPTPDIMRIQHIQVHIVKPKPATMGLTREVRIPGNVIPPAVTRPRLAVSVSFHAAIMPVSPTTPLIILSGLLAALLIALWGMHIGQSTSSITVSTLPVPNIPQDALPAFTAPGVTPLSELYVNEFSPVLVPRAEQLSRPSEPQPTPAFSGAGGGGLLKRHADADALPRKIRLRPVSIVHEPVQQLSEQVGLSELLPKTPVPISNGSIQEKTPELIRAEARPKGLLHRYALEKQDNE